MIASIIPILPSDEQYYMYWGTYWAGGYYDHPPMIGWWEYVFFHIFYSKLGLRLPIICSIIAVAIGIYRWLIQYDIDSKKSLLIAALWFSAPLNFFAVFVLTDFSLLFFSFFSSICFFNALENLKNNRYFQSNRFFLFAGIFWGGAFLSKYFAIFLLPAYIMAAIRVSFSFKKGFRLCVIYPLVIFFAGSTPFLLQHFYWNMTHCWGTLFFHLTRQSKLISVLYALFYFIIYIFLHISPVWWRETFLYRGKNKNSIPIRNYVGLLWILPSCLFLISIFFGQEPALNWYYFIFPYFFIWIGLKFEIATLFRKLIQSTIITMSIAVVVVILALFPPRFLIKPLWLKDFNAQTIIDQKPLIAKISPYFNQVDLILIRSWQYAGLFALELIRYQVNNNLTHVPTVGVTEQFRQFGREFDYTVNLKKFDGKDVLIISTVPQNFLMSYFDKISINKLLVHYKGLTAFYYITKGHHFHAHEYIEEQVKPYLDKYYWHGSQCMNPKIIT